MAPPIKLGHNPNVTTSPSQHLGMTLSLKLCPYLIIIFVSCLLDIKKIFFFFSFQSKASIMK